VSGGGSCGDLCRSSQCYSEGDLRADSRGDCQNDLPVDSQRGSHSDLRRDSKRDMREDFHGDLDGGLRGAARCPAGFYLSVSPDSVKRYWTSHIVRLESQP